MSSKVFGDGHKKLSNMSLLTMTMCENYLTITYYTLCWIMLRVIKKGSWNPFFNPTTHAK